MVSSLATMEIPEPIDVLPHRPPFLFVTAVTAVEPGPFRTDWSGRSLKQVTNPIED